MSKLSRLKKKTVDEIYSEVLHKKDMMFKIDINSWTAQGISVRKENIKDTLCLFLMPVDNFNGTYIYYIYDSDYSYPINRDEFDFAAYLAYAFRCIRWLPRRGLAMYSTV